MSPYGSSTTRSWDDHATTRIDLGDLYRERQQKPRRARTMRERRERADTAAAHLRALFWLLACVAAAEVGWLLLRLAMGWHG